MDKNKNTKKKQAFTLVELIIVITILSILATIAFISFQGYTKDSRDSNRLATIENLKKGVDLFQIASGKLPDPDNQYGTGTFNGVPLTYVGNIGDSLSRIIKVNTIPLDPLSKEKYKYGIDASKSKYQIATVLENSQASIFLQTTYASTGYKAKVVGNYEGLLKTSNNVYNLPSLITTDSGAYELTGSTLNYVIDKGENLPYSVGDITQLNVLSPTEVLQKLSNTVANLSVTGITIPTDMTTWNTQSGAISQALGYTIDTIGGSMYGETYFTDNANISGETNNTTPATHGVCGTLNALTTVTYPTGTNACQTGNQTTVDNLASDGSFNWTCDGSNGGNNVSCGANLPQTKFPGEDGIVATADDCSADNIHVPAGCTPGAAGCQIWSACNLGAKTAYNGSNAGTYNGSGNPTRGGDETVNGKMYQWGRNKGFPGTDTLNRNTQITSYNSASDSENFVGGAAFTNNDWLNPQNPTIWGGSSTDTITTDGQTNKILRKGPCPTGRHIPSTKEWYDACFSIIGGACTNGVANTTVRNTLKLPLAGYRDAAFTSSYKDQGNNGYYWSSSQNSTSTQSLVLSFNTTGMRASTPFNRVHGMSVRCIKD